MPKLQYTKTAGDLFERVKTTFGDSSGVQIVSADVLRWINDAQREIVETNNTLLAKATTNVVAGQSVYIFNGHSVNHFQSVHFDGEIIRPMSFQDAQSYVINNEQKKATSDPELWYEYDGDITIWPTPQKDIPGGLVLYYSAQPEDVYAMTDKITVPDIYFNAMFAIVMRQAYALDENWTGYQALKGEAQESLTRLSEQSNIQQTNLYPFVTVDEDDLW